MKITLAVCGLLFAAWSATAEEIRVKIEANEEVDELVKNLRKQFSEKGHTLEVVFDGSYKIRIIGISEESMFAGAQGTIVVLSPECEVLAAVTRSGRMSRGGAFDAAAKEVVKQLDAIGAID
jgi:hypothetical protein